MATVWRLVWTTVCACVHVCVHAITWCVMLQYWLLGTTVCCWVLLDVNIHQQATHVSCGGPGLQTGASGGWLQVGHSHYLVSAGLTSDTLWKHSYFHKWYNCNIKKMACSFKMYRKCKTDIFKILFLGQYWTLTKIFKFKCTFLPIHQLNASLYIHFG